MTLAQQKVVHQELRIEKDTKITTTRYLEKRTKMKKEKVVIVSGYFDPLHVGHLEYLRMASQLGDTLLVIVNNDEQACLKKGKPFMPFQERMTIVQALKPVTLAIESIDEGDTVTKTLQWVRALYKSKFSEMIFCNGGDRTYEGNTPEYQACLELGIEPVFGLGEKIQSSRWLINGTEKT